MRVLVIACPLRLGGGELRAFNSIKWLVERGIEVGLYLPSGATYKLMWLDASSRRKGFESLRELARLGVKVIGYSYTALARIPIRASMLALLASRYRALNSFEPDLVLSYHECVDSVEAALHLSRIFRVPVAVLLQLPPFYRRDRARNIARALALWRECVGDIISFTYREVVSMATERKARKLYRELAKAGACLLAVSRAVPMDMGEPWANSIPYLDPGVSLSEDEVELIRRVRAREKKNFVVFGGRPMPEKGLIEAIIVFKAISRVFNELKLIVTGYIKEYWLQKLERFVRNLGIKDKVIFTGFVSREERLRIVSQAKLVIYPSHVDAFPYSVLEAIALGTPVVGYNIPALEAYYKGVEGIELVEEGDLEALAAKVVELLNSRVVPRSIPELPTWNEVMECELEYWKGCVQRARVSLGSS